MLSLSTGRCPAPGFWSSSAPIPGGQSGCHPVSSGRHVGDRRPVMACTLRWTHNPQSLVQDRMSLGSHCVTTGRCRGDSQPRQTYAKSGGRQGRGGAGHGNDQSRRCPFALASAPWCCGEDLGAAAGWGRPALPSPQALVVCGAGPGARPRPPTLSVFSHLLLRPSCRSLLPAHPRPGNAGLQGAQRRAGGQAALQPAGGGPLGRPEPQFSEAQPQQSPHPAPRRAEGQAGPRAPLGLPQPGDCCGMDTCLGPSLPP